MFGSSIHKQTVLFLRPNSLGPPLRQGHLAVTHAASKEAGNCYVHASQFKGVLNKEIVLANSMST